MLYVVLLPDFLPGSIGPVQLDATSVHSVRNRAELWWDTPEMRLPEPNAWCLMSSE